MSDRPERVVTEKIGETYASLMKATLCPMVSTVPDPLYPCRLTRESCGGKVKMHTYCYC